VAAADLNGDGHPDLVATNYGASNVSVLLGNGDGTFQAAVGYGTDSAPRDVVIADFNGDGKPDIAVCNENSNDVSILLGNGDGTFQQPPMNFAALMAPAAIATADFNGDSIPDLAVAASGSNAVGVLLGNGDGTFGLPASYAVGSGPLGVAAGDLNGDGRIDLVVANFDSYPGTTAVLFGNGDGTFQPALYLPAGACTAVPVIADFNQDGRPDFAVTDRCTNQVIVFTGNGNGTFQAPLYFPSGLETDRIAVADFNGDGKPDLAISDYGFGAIGANTVNVLLNDTGKTVTVSAMAEISAAGYFAVNTTDGTGVMPPSIALPAGATSVKFSITGGTKLDLPGYGSTCAAPCITINLQTGDNYNNADGVGAAEGMTASAAGSISGITAPTSGFVTGVFENGGTPSGAPPPTLNFTRIGTSFPSLSPKLNQLFFIGDGLTGDGTGTKQTFKVPAGATVLYLGVVDACGYVGSPGCYFDDVGDFVVSYTIATAPGEDQ
jgi:hypothetical protein